MSDGAVADSGPSDLGKEGWSYLTFVVLLVLSTLLGREAVVTGYFPFEVLFVVVAVLLVALLGRRVFCPVLRLRAAKDVALDNLEAGMVERASNAPQVRASDEETVPPAESEAISPGSARGQSQEFLADIYAKMRIGSLEEAIAGAGKPERKLPKEPAVLAEEAKPLPRTTAQRAGRRPVKRDRRKRAPSQTGSSQRTSLASSTSDAPSMSVDTDCSTAASETADRPAKKKRSKKSKDVVEILHGDDSSDDDTFVKRWVERRRRIAAGADADAPTELTSVSVLKKKEAVETKFEPCGFVNHTEGYYAKTTGTYESYSDFLVALRQVPYRTVAESALHGAHPFLRVYTQDVRSP